MGTRTTLQRALKLIEQGALNRGKLSQLADRLGIGERYLRKLFERELGVSPHAIALNQRLLFARKLLLETSMPVTEVAFSAGFGSVRRFNSAIKDQFRQSPTELRRTSRRDLDREGISLQLHYRPPYDWQGVVNFLSRHTVAGVERVDAQGYHRNLYLGGHRATISVRPVAGRDALELVFRAPNHSMLMPVVAAVRRMFDLDANPAAIAATLGAEPALAPLLARYPGVRSPGSFSVFESAVRAIVGQQVSTEAARTICSRFAAATSDADFPVFPTAHDLAGLDDGQFPMPGRRRETLKLLSQTFCEREEELCLTALADLQGVGPWTVAMVAIRGVGEPDAFPTTDLGLKKAWEPATPGATSLQKQSEQWQPWRSYAANLLWRSL
ncbi:MAG: AlkA N-terminal domain-containing protein [Pseudomonadota bacterium]